MTGRTCPLRSPIGIHSPSNRYSISLVGDMLECMRTICSGVGERPQCPCLLPEEGSLMIRHIICLLSLAYVSGFHFFLNLLDDYLAIDNHRDSFYFDLLPSLAFFILLVGAFIAFAVNSFRSPRRPAALICCLLVVICAGASSWFRHDIISLSDKAFFWVNEANFRDKARAANGAVVLHSRSSVSFSKQFIYAGSRPLADGNVSQEELNSRAAQFSAIEGGCKVEAQSLKDNFYVLSIYCG